MLRKGAVLACVASAAAFAPAQLPLASRQKYAAAPAMALQNPVAQLSKGTVAAALLLSTAGPMMPAPVFADTAANPYAKAGELEAAKAATENKKASSSSNNAALIAVPLVASVVLGLPFYKRNLERMGEKAQGKR